MSSAPLLQTLVSGTVARYDSEAGLGEVADAEGRRWPFHCTAISDGSREIDPATAVAFAIAPGGPGQWEARPVIPL
mgnify:CR=1 FL=1|jgi:cold shock CspA family protein